MIGNKTFSVLRFFYLDFCSSDKKNDCNNLRSPQEEWSSQYWLKYISIITLYDKITKQKKQTFKHTYISYHIKFKVPILLINIKCFSAVGFELVFQNFKTIIVSVMFSFQAFWNLTLYSFEICRPKKRAMNLPISAGHPEAS